MYPFRQANVPLGIHVPQVGTPWVICFGKRHPNKASFAYIKCYHAWTQTSIGQNGGITLNFELWENFLPSWWFLRCQACMEARRRQAPNGGCTSNEWSRRWSFPTVVLWRKSMGCFLIRFCSYYSFSGQCQTASQAVKTSFQSTLKQQWTTTIQEHVFLRRQYVAKSLSMDE